jgi:hypothetical protein
MATSARWRHRQDARYRSLRHLTITSPSPPKDDEKPFWPRSACGAPYPARQTISMSSRNRRVGGEQRAPRISLLLCLRAAHLPTEILFRIGNRYNNRRPRKRRAHPNPNESSDLNTTIQISSTGTMATKEIPGIGQLGTSAGSLSSWECSRSQPV